MDVHKIISQLHEERARLTDAIVSLEHVARGRGRRRGRPPAWMKEAASPPKSRRSQRMKARSKPET